MNLPQRPHLVDTVRAVRNAGKVVDTWPADVWLEVVASAPLSVSCTSKEWCITVEAFRKPGENVVLAAGRLALYLDLHAERYAGETPDLEKVTDRALQDNDRLDLTIQEN